MDESGIKHCTPVLQKRRFRTTGDYRKLCASIYCCGDQHGFESTRNTHSSKSPWEICRSILDGDFQYSPGRVLSLQKILRWLIIYCDSVPKRIIRDELMIRFVWDVLGCRQGLPDQETLNNLVDSFYHDTVLERNNRLRSCTTCQVSINMKSFRGVDRKVEQVMVTTFRPGNGQVLGWIGHSNRLEGTSSDIISGALLENMNMLGVSTKVSGYVIESSSSSQVCRKLEELLPKAVAFPCQSYALRKLLKSMIQTDIYLQQMLQDCCKLYDEAEKKNLCSADLMCEIRSWVHLLRGNEIKTLSKIQLCPYILCIDKLRDDWGLATFSHRLAFSSENEHFWTQLASYAKLLEPLVHCVAYLENNQPSLGQMHLIWHCMLRHVDLWCDLVSKEKQTSTYSMNCFSTEKIKQHFYEYRNKYYHPSFTLGYLLDCRLWSVSLGIARPNTSRLSYDEINEARKLASRMSLHPNDVTKELTHLVQCGVKDDTVDIFKSMKNTIHSGWAIQNDSCPNQMVLLNKAWGIDGSSSTLRTSFPLLSRLFQSLSNMKGTVERSKSIPSVLKWLIKRRDNGLSYDIANKMASIALSARIVPDTGEQTSSLSYFGIDSMEFEQARQVIHEATWYINGDRDQESCRADALYQTPPSQPLRRGDDSALIASQRKGCSNVTKHRASALLQLTDQTNRSSLGWIQGLSSKQEQNEGLKAANAREESEKHRNLVQKNLLGDFDLPHQPHKKARMQS